MTLPPGAGPSNAGPDDSGPHGFGFEPADLDGHTVEELADYLERGRTPSDPSIDDSPGCQIALAAITRLQAISKTFLDSDAVAEPDHGERWVNQILTSIGLDARAGRDIPVQHSDPSASLILTEGAVRGMIRAAGDSVGGVLIGRCRLEGDVTVANEPVAVLVDASVFWGERMTDAAERIRQAIYSALVKHTELTISTIDVTIHDVYLARARPDQIEEP